MGLHMHGNNHMYTLLRAIKKKSSSTNLDDDKKFIYFDALTSSAPKIFIRPKECTMFMLNYYNYETFFPFSPMHGNGFGPINEQIILQHVLAQLKSLEPIQSSMLFRISIKEKAP